MKAIIIGNPNIQQILSQSATVLAKYDEGEIPEHLKGQATLSAMKGMFNGKYFSICEVEKLANLNGVHIPTETHDYFRVLHCVHFADMTEETREFLFAKCIELSRSSIAMSGAKLETV